MKRYLGSQVSKPLILGLDTAVSLLPCDPGVSVRRTEDFAGFHLDDPNDCGTSYVSMSMPGEGWPALGAGRLVTWVEVIDGLADLIGLDEAMKPAETPDLTGAGDLGPLAPGSTVELVGTVQPWPGPATSLYWSVAIDPNRSEAGDRAARLDLTLRIRRVAWRDQATGDDFVLWTDGTWEAQLVPAYARETVSANQDSEFGFDPTPGTFWTVQPGGIGSRIEFIWRFTHNYDYGSTQNQKLKLVWSVMHGSPGNKGSGLANPDSGYTPKYSNGSSARSWSTDKPPRKRITWTDDFQFPATQKDGYLGVFVEHGFGSEEDDRMALFCLQGIIAVNVVTQAETRLWPAQVVVRGH